jgi:hypothetical protein
MDLDDELREIQLKKDGLVEIKVDSKYPEHRFDLLDIDRIRIQYQHDNIELPMTFGIDIGDYCPLTGLLCRCLENCVCCEDCPDDEREKMRDEIRKAFGDDDLIFF